MSMKPILEASDAPPCDYDRAAEHEGMISQRDEAVPMRDGKVLRADVYRPQHLLVVGVRVAGARDHPTVCEEPDHLLRPRQLGRQGHHADHTGTDKLSRESQVHRTQVGRIVGAFSGWGQKRSLHVRSQYPCAGWLRGFFQGLQKRIVAFGGPGDSRWQERGRPGLWQLAGQRFQRFRFRSHVNAEGAVYLEVDETRADQATNFAMPTREVIGTRGAYNVDDLAVLYYYRCRSDRFGGEDVTDEGVRCRLHGHLAQPHTRLTGWCRWRPGRTSANLSERCRRLH